MVMVGVPAPMAVVTSMPMRTPLPEVAPSSSRDGHVGVVMDCSDVEVTTTPPFSHRRSAINEMPAGCVVLPAAERTFMPAILHSPDAGLVYGRAPVVLLSHVDPLSVAGGDPAVGDPVLVQAENMALAEPAREFLSAIV